MTETKQDQDTNKGRDWPLHLGHERILDALGWRDHAPRLSPVPGPAYPMRRDALQTGLGRILAALDGRDDGL